MTQENSNIPLRSELPPEATVGPPGLAPILWAVMTSLGVMILTIAYSGTVSENFSDLTTGTMAFTGVGDKSVEITGAVASVAVGTLAGFLAARSRRTRIRAAGSPARVGPLTAPPALLVVSACLFALACTALAARTVLSAFGVQAGLWPWLAALLIFLATTAGVRRMGGDAPRDVSVLVAAQSLLGAGAFAILPATAPPSEGPDTGTWVTGTAWIAAAAICLVVFLVSALTARSMERGSAQSPRDFANGAGIVVASVAVSSAVTVPLVPRDGYHFGELVSPSYLASAWGQAPYLDQFPARGLLVNFVPSWISDVVAAPGGGLVALGHPWLTLALVSAAYLLASRTLPIGAAVLVTTTTAFAAANLIAIGDVAMLLALLLLYGISRWRHQFLWPTSALMGIILALAAPAQGSAWCVAVTILVVTTAIADRRRLPGPLSALATFVVIGTALVLAPVRRSLLAAFGYVASQGSVNDQVWGTPWLWVLGVQASTPGTTPVLEPVRAAVLPVIAVMAFLVLRQVAQHRAQAVALPASLAVLAYLALQLPRALGRIDPDGISRVGALTLVVAGVGLPLLASRARWFAWTRTATLAVVLVVAPLILLDGGLAKLATFAARAGYSTDATAGGTLVAAGGPFGGAMIESGLRSEYSKLSQQLHQLPGAQDGLLDLTNNQADFRYLQVGNALSYGAAYNITSRPVEASELDRLTKRTPRIALLTSNLSKWHDGGSLGLRTPSLYRWVLDHYDPVQCGTPGVPGFAVWGTTDGTAPSGCSRAQSPAQKVEMFERAMTPPPDLGALARSWGSARATGVAAVLHDPVPAPLVIAKMHDSVDVRLMSTPPRDARDVLRLRLACGGWTTANVTWFDPKDPALRATSVELGGGESVLSMGAFPSFLLREAPLEVHIRIRGTTRCEEDAKATWARYSPQP